MRIKKERGVKTNYIQYRADRKVKDRDDEVLDFEVVCGG